MFVIIRMSNADRISRRFATRDEAIEHLRWMNVDSEAHPDTFAVQELDAEGRLVGAPVRQQPAGV